MLDRQVCNPRKWSRVSMTTHLRNFLPSAMWVRLRKGHRQRLNHVRPSNCKFKASNYGWTNRELLNRSWELGSPCKISTVLSNIITCSTNKMSLGAPFQVITKTKAITVVKHVAATLPRTENIRKILNNLDPTTKFDVLYQIIRTKIINLSSTNSTLKMAKFNNNTSNSSLLELLWATREINNIVAKSLFPRLL